MLPNEWNLSLADCADYDAILTGGPSSHSGKSFNNKNHLHWQGVAAISIYFGHIKQWVNKFGFELSISAVTAFIRFT